MNGIKWTMIGRKYFNYIFSDLYLNDIHIETWEEVIPV